jgi:hypothetical protein
MYLKNLFFGDVVTAQIKLCTTFAPNGLGV